MALSDILTLPFLLSLGLTLLLTGLLGMFFLQKLQEQNHKMTSMLGLVSTMAEELNFIRGRLQYSMQTGGSNQGITITPTPERNVAPLHLIPVSDGENDDEEDDNEEDDSEDDDEDDDEDNDEDDDEDDDEGEGEEDTMNVIEISNNESVKIINFADSFAPASLEAEELDCTNDEGNDLDEGDESDDLDEGDDLDELDEGDEGDDLDEGDTLEELEEFHQGNTNTNTNVDLHDIEELNEVENVQGQVKTIPISTLEESHMIDYKKLSLNKLKSIAISKGLIKESSKATKQAILKLLGVE